MVQTVVLNGVGCDHGWGCGRSRADMQREYVHRLYVVTYLSIDEVRIKIMRVTGCYIL